MEQFLNQFEKYDHPLYGFVRLPEVIVTDEEKASVGLKPEATNTEFLKALTRKGFKAKIGSLERNGVLNAKDIYGARCKRELEIVERLGFVDYFLLVWRVTSEADKRGIARDYGRGSCAGSLIFFLIGVTFVDPIKYQLFFERFISEARAKKKVVDGITYIDGGLAPDVDIDIEQARREEMVDFVKDSYKGKVCKISTLSTLSGKLLIKECSKIVSGLPEDECKRVSDMIPKDFGIVWDIEEAYNGKWDDEKKDWDKKPVEEFKIWCDEHPEVYQVALGLRDIIKNKGTHPSGYVVAQGELTTFLPVELTKEDKEEDSDDETTYAVSSSFTMDDVAYLTIKLDLLGVRSCSVVAEVLKMTGDRIEDINVDNDPIIYDNLQNLETPHGIFQIEAPTNLKVCRSVKPRNLDELSDVVAIARPGALSFLSKYVENKCEPVFESFDPILARTRGVCLYQEQMMQLASAIGFTLEQAETLRRVVGKKKIEEVGEWKEKIQNKIQEKGLPVHIGELLWKILEDSSKYSFNLSHSISYAALAALTTYLKFKYPLQFFTALLKQVKNEPKPIEEIQKIQAELKKFGIKLLPPDFTKSKIDFEIEGNDIRFGLSSIKGMGEKTMRHLMDFEMNNANRFKMFDNAENAGLGIGVVAALIQCGCLDEIRGTASRPSLVLQAQLWNILTKKERGFVHQYGPEFNYDLFKTFNHVRTLKNEKGKLLIADSRAGTIKKKYAPKKEIYEQNKPNIHLANFFYERMLIGYSYSVRLFDIFAPHYDNLITVQEVEEAQEKERVEFVAVIAEKVQERVSVNKNKYCRFTLTDETGTIEAILSNSQRQQKLDDIKARHGGKLPQKDAIVFCTGQKGKSGSIYIDSMADQCIKIYTKFAQLDKKKKEENVE